MTLCVNHVTLATVRCRYLKKSVRLFSPEGLRVKNPNLIFIILAYRATFGTDTAPVWFTGNKRNSDF